MGSAVPIRRDCREFEWRARPGRRESQAADPYGDASSTSAGGVARALGVAVSESAEPYRLASNTSVGGVTKALVSQ